MQLIHALRLDSPGSSSQIISLVGAGGKSTAMFKIARELLGMGVKMVIVTSTTHIGAWQVENADNHLLWNENDQRLRNLDDYQGVVLVTRGENGNRLEPIPQLALEWLREKSKNYNLPLLIEADGSRMHPLKAPAEHEPPIPSFCDIVIVVAGLSAIGNPLDEDHAHRAEISACR